MAGLDKIYPFLVLLSVCVGVVLGQVTELKELASSVIVPLLALMLYFTFLPLPLKNFGRVLRNPKVAVTSLVINFVWTPIFAWVLGLIFLRETPDLWVGLIMFMVTPCTDWYLVFTGIAGGDVILATALLPFNLILQVFLLPIYLLIFAGTLVTLNPTELFASVLLVLLIPLLLAIVFQRFFLLKKGRLWFDQVSSKINTIQIFTLNLAILAIFTSESGTFLQHPQLFLKLFIPIVIFFVVNFILAAQIVRYLNFSYEEYACFCCTILARNSPLSLAIAASAFPDQPLITLPLVIAPLIELPIMVFISQSLSKIRRQE